MSEGTEPIDGNEYLYRKVPVSQEWVDEHGLSGEAFRPHKRDTTGLSLERAKYRSIEDAGQGKSKKGYYVAVLRAGDLRDAGIQVEPRPVEGNSGHCEIVDLTYDNRKSNSSLGLMRKLAKDLCTVKGPFPPSTGT